METTSGLGLKIPSDSDYFDITKCLRDYNFEIDNE